MPPLSLENFQGLEESIGYHFKNRSLILEALTHKSYYYENPEKSIGYNERLEFLGDAVLGLAISEYLFRKFSGESESRLAYLKAFLVKESILFEIATKIKLGQYLLIGKGEELTGGREKPSIIADAIEAVIGAVFMDGGFVEARRLVYRLFEKKLEEICSEELVLDPKSELQKRSLELYGKLPEYKVISTSGKEHNKVFTVSVYINGEFFGTGTGKSKKKAQAEAARAALLKISGFSSQSE